MLRVRAVFLIFSHSLGSKLCETEPPELQMEASYKNRGLRIRKLLEFGVTTLIPKP